MTAMRLDDLAHRDLPLHLTPAPQPASAPPDPAEISLRSRSQAGANPPAGSATATSTRREVLGFATYWELDHYSEWNLQLLTTVAYFGLDVNGDGSVNTSDSSAQGWNSSALSSLVANAHSVGDRVVLVVKPSSATDMYNLIASPSATAAMVANIESDLAAKGLDGINVDFEGQNDQNNTRQGQFTSFMKTVYGALKAKSGSNYVTVDTYTGSADWTGGFFNIADLAPYTDAFFVMAYDMATANTPGQASANAPLSGWTYSDNQAATNYLKLVPPSQVILGVPYYGVKFSTRDQSYNSSATAGPTSEPYSGSTSVLSDLACSGAVRQWQQTASSPWAAWWSPPSGDPCGGDWNSNREMYWDDSESLGFKYDLVNARDLRGTGIWALGYDTGRTELWDELRQKFLQDTTAPTPSIDNPPASPSTTGFQVTFSATDYGSGVRTFALQVGTGSGPWLDWTSVGVDHYSGGAAYGGLTFYGIRGQSYSFRLRAIDYAGNVSGFSAASTAAAVGSSATLSNTFAGLYTLDGFGGVHGVQSPPLSTSDYWPNWQIARGLAVRADGGGGYVLDGYGGLHPFGSATGPVQLQDYWNGWDIARDAALLPDGSGGVVLDGYGGLHPFGVAGAAAPGPIHLSDYWPGQDIARRVALYSDGTGGVVLDGFGGLHPFTIGSAPWPAPLTETAYWPGWNIARGVALIAGTHSGYVLDGYGGLHPFGPQGQAVPNQPNLSGYWQGQDVARAVYVSPGSSGGSPAGWVFDAYGVPHQYGSAGTLVPWVTWPGWAIAADAAGN
ncbi:MAG: glycosyl hydrolase family 18 protein [Candidatus Dormibacteria bacterium]